MFTFELRDDVMRKLSRKQYYEVYSWLRHCRRIVRGMLP